MLGESGHLELHVAQHQVELGLTGIVVVVGLQLVALGLEGLLLCAHDGDHGLLERLPLLSLLLALLLGEAAGLLRLLWLCCVGCGVLALRVVVHHVLVAFEQNRLLLQFLGQAAMLLLRYS